MSHGAASRSAAGGRHAPPTGGRIVAEPRRVGRYVLQRRQVASIVLKKRIDAPTQVLWTYVATAGGLSCWQADDVQGSLESGNFSLRWPQLGARLDLSVSSVELGECIVLRAGQNALSLRITKDHLELEHEGLDVADDLDGLRSSWKLALSLLRHAVEQHPQKERRVTWNFCPVPASHELLHYYFSTTEGLRSWLGELSPRLRVGERYQLKTDNGVLEGTVLLNDEGRDVALSVDQLDQGVLVLRTLPSAEGRVVALGVSTWEPSTLTDSLTEHLEGCLTRLAGALTDRGTT